jgi:hypothetical protein
MLDVLEKHNKSQPPQLYLVTFVRYLDECEHGDTDCAHILTQTLFTDVYDATRFVNEELLMYIHKEDGFEAKLAQFVDKQYLNEAGSAIAEVHMQHNRSIHPIAKSFFRGEHVRSTLDWQLVHLNIHEKEAVEERKEPSTHAKKKTAEGRRETSAEDIWIVTFLRFRDNKVMSQTLFDDLDHIDNHYEFSDCTGVVSSDLFDDLDNAEQFVCEKLLVHMREEGKSDADIARSVDERYRNETGDAISQAHLLNLPSMSEIAKSFFKGEHVVRRLHWVLQKLPVHRPDVIGDSKKSAKRTGSVMVEDEPAAKFAKLV